MPDRGEHVEFDAVWIPAQTTTVGSNKHYPEEAPAHQVSVEGFWIARHQVTNAQFGAFVEATGYLTVAQRPLNRADHPGAPPENLQPAATPRAPRPAPPNWATRTPRWPSMSPTRPR